MLLRDHNRDMTDTENRTRKTSGTQGILLAIYYFFFRKIAFYFFSTTGNSDFDFDCCATIQTGPLGMLAPPKKSTTANRAVQSGKKNRGKYCQKQEKHPLSSNIRSYLFY